jgi:hypothetical protein
MRSSKIGLSVTALALLGVAASRTHQTAESEYIAQALSAAPDAVAKGAAVIRLEEDGSKHPLRTGKNEFTCMMFGADKICADRNSMEFIDAMNKGVPPPNKIGISYMLAGDTGRSNTDPYATSKTTDNHWIVSGPHILVLGPPSKALGYTEAADPDSSKPFMMWAGTPFEHAMIPVAPKN